jgi:hypothetical protein
MHIRSFAALVLAAAACATASAPKGPTTFTYAPPPGTKYVRTVKLVSETSLPGTPYRQLEEREFVWNVSIGREGDSTLVKQQLQRLEVRINGADVLDGERSASSDVSVDLLVDRSAQVTEVRGAEKAAQLLAALARPGAREVAETMFTPQLVKEIAVARFDMVVRDIVGRPTAPGSSWTVPDEDPAVRTKTLTVDRTEPCGRTSCARVSAEYAVNPSAGARRALQSAATFLARNGVDPRSAEVADATLQYRDELLLEPATMVDHGASFSQTARVVFAGAGGQPVPVEFKSSLEQGSEFP